MIFNKDGKVYILKGPNPLVDKQENWSPSKLVFHNFDWDDIKLKSPSQIEKLKTDMEKIKEIKIQEKIESPIFVEPAAAAICPAPAKTMQVEAKQEIEKSFDLPYIKYKVLSYCLPAMLEMRTDNFYGDKWSRLKYGKKFVFPSVIIDAADFMIEFWTSDPNEQITENSIIYPFSYEVHNQETDAYDKIPYDEYRWWKVTEKEKKEEGGWLFKAIPSESQPDFSS